MHARPYEALSPHCVLDAAAAVGLQPTGRFLPLNSYENRVYMLDVESAAGVVIKFYRPGRWSDDQIAEEHRFARELAAGDLGVVPPLSLAGRTLHVHEGFRYAVYPRVGGRWPEFANREDRLELGRFLGRVHGVGAVSAFEHRLSLAASEEMGEARDYLLGSHHLPPELEEPYAAASGHLVESVREAESRCGSLRRIRIHGDLHAGNILWQDGLQVVDLDDCGTGPAIQDVWMLLPTDAAEREPFLDALLEGYETFCSFDLRELGLIESLRARRIMLYAAWLALRWDDPAFPRAFPWFGESRYWEQHVLNLKEQHARMLEELI
jgi:Ser/Thr protein kinase RdoA (MazF antagonist)